MFVAFDSSGIDDGWAVTLCCRRSRWDGEGTVRKQKPMWQEYLEACVFGVVTVAGGVYIAIMAAVVTVGAMR